MAFLCFLGFFRSQLICLFSTVVFLQILAGVTSSSSLYSPDDPLWELDASNFGHHVFGKSNAWIIEFYNSWCGHCIKFAPTWKAFAKDIQTWKNVIDVAVINCAESQNVKLCRNYEVESYPTIKLFWVNLNEDSKGSLLTGHRDVDSMRHFVIKYLESNWSGGVPESWPNLESPLSESLSDLWRDVPERVNHITLIAEKPNSFAGREVILDFSFRKHPIIRRVLATNSSLINDLNNVENSSGTVLLKLGRDGSEELLHRFPNGANDTFIRNRIFEILAGYPRSSYSESFAPDQPVNPKGSKVHGVYMRDLENALLYTLRQEISVHQHIAGPKLSALKAFLSALRMYFPGSPSVMAYLGKLSSWASHQKNNITGEDFLEALDQLQTKREYLPEMRAWIGCKGSKPRYRGYPCSLWTLFHTLSVQAYTMYETDPLYMKEDPHKLVFTIRDYVKYFFTCAECSRHFQIMAANLVEEVRNPQDTVLWLWNAHNKVNRRLAGDATEDPQHPKVQFPPIELCSKCRLDVENASQEIRWDTNAVLRFLLHFYGRQNIIKDDGKNMEENDIANNSLHFQNSRNDRIQNNERDGSEASTMCRKCQVLYAPAALLIWSCLYHFQKF